MLLECEIIRVWYERYDNKYVVEMGSQSYVVSRDPILFLQVPASPTTTPMSTSSPFSSTRASSSIPPASKAYEQPLKAELAHKLKHTILAHSSAFSFALYILFFSSGDNVGLLARLLSLRVWLVAALSWAVGVLPVIVLRKAHLSGRPTFRTCVSFLIVLVADGTGATSPAGTMAAALAKPSTRRSVWVYTVSALLLLVLHLRDVSALKESVPLNIFLKSKSVHRDVLLRVLVVMLIRRSGNIHSI